MHLAASGKIVRPEFAVERSGGNFSRLGSRAEVQEFQYVLLLPIIFLKKAQCPDDIKYMG